MDSSKTILWKMICLFLMALFFFCTNAFSARNDVVRIGLNYDISTVNMLEAKLGVDLPVLLAIHEPLMGADPQTGVKIPILAEFFQVMENQKDIKVTLRKDARFHTGDAVTLQKYLADVGISVKLQQLEAGTQATYARSKDPREGPLVLFSWAGGRDPSTRLLLSIVSTSIYGGYPNRPNKEEMDKWCVDQAHELDEEKRRTILQQIHEVMIDDPGSTLLFGLNMIYAMSDRIEYSWTPNEAFLFNAYTIRVVNQ